MKPPADYTALHDIQVPGSYAFAARTGDELTEDQRTNLGLTVGLDVTPLRPNVIPEPDADADRAAWQDYAVQQGVPYATAVNLDLADLRTAATEAASQPEAEQEARYGTRPAETDLKAAWAAYAASELVRAGASPDMAQQAAEGRTKADLVAMFGDPGDADLRGQFFADAGQAEGEAGAHAPQPQQPVAQG